MAVTDAAIGARFGPDKFATGIGSSSLMRTQDRRERLQPGDRSLLYTDGVLEVRDPDEEFFGTERLVAFTTRQSAAGLPAAETLRRLNDAILAPQHGMLQDDTTTVMVEWLTDQPERSIP